MAVLDFNAATPRVSILSRMGTALWDALISYSHARARTAEFEHFNAMSDEQLAAIKLRREDIARHVFRDVII